MVDPVRTGVYASSQPKQSYHARFSLVTGDKQNQTDRVLELVPGFPGVCHSGL